MTIRDVDFASVELRLLECFRALVEERSVSRAAVRMQIGQPAMSNALARLRQLFQDPLFVRVGGEMQPTDLALELHQPVKELLQRSEDLFRLRGPFDPAHSSRGFSLMAAEYVEYVLIGPLASRLQKEAPSVRLDIWPPDRERAFHLLETGEIDFRLGWWPNPPTSLKQLKLFEDKLVCVVRRGHPHAEDLTTTRFIEGRHARVRLPRMLGSSVAIDRALDELGAQIDIAVCVQNAFDMAYAVVDTDLIITLPERQAIAFRQMLPVQIVPCPLRLPVMEVAIYWHERTHASAPHKWLRGIIKNIADGLA